MVGATRSAAILRRYEDGKVFPDVANVAMTQLAAMTQIAREFHVVSKPWRHRWHHGTS